MKLTAPLSHLLLAFLFLVSACSSTQTERIDAETSTDAETDTDVAAGKILIVYLSRTKNTKAVAEMIQKNVGGKLVAIELEKPYPENYQATVAQVASENQSGYLPPLKTKIDSIGQYDVVFVGFPTWGMQLPPPMKSFLKQYDLSGKTIIPFNTNGGYGIGSTFETVRQLCPNSKISEGYSTRGGLERDGQLLMIKDDKARQTEDEIKQWLGSLKMI
ncbi:flavodoxin [Dyadobacter sp. Leaf189]|uniref:flavodoxin n=1 Tax=Dyadobacter sp. Leaf189 TaxID=1736295 RepID=UPI0006F96442|nr:flavodoxin [Dyadobacter sp. Leaf189]KQS26685.1 flavodoxin [Dyadobacter sp. Leaf189]